MRGKPMSPDLFWDRVDKSGDCWLWKGAVGKSGYGVVGYQYKSWSAHRLAWFFTNGDIPEGLFVCHKCDNRICCNPSHLWLDTPENNSKDMISKDRSLKGERSPVRLHPESIKYGDEHWSHKNPELVRKGENHHKAKLSNDLVRQVRKRIKNGESKRIIASELKMDLSSIYLIANNKIWKHVED